MDLLKPYRFVLALAAVCLALPAVAVGARLPQSTAATVTPASNTATFTDSTGDTKGADIQTVVVSNDDTGMLTFKINVPNRPILGQDMVLDIFVNTDNNAATGSPDLGGVDYVMEQVQGEINLFKWDGTTFSRRFGDPSAVTLSSSYANGFTVRISAAELGNTKAFGFLVIVEDGVVIDPVTGTIDDTNANVDAAPGGGAGFYPYEVKVAPPTLVVKSFTHSPARPTAGKTFTLRLTAARSDTGAVLQGGQVTCVGRAGTTRLVAIVHRVTGGAATCTFRIPKTAKGKTFRGTDTVVFEGQKATRSFSGKIR